MAAKISELFRQPVMVYVSSDARHFTNGHNSQPVRIVDADERGVLVKDAHPNSSPDLVFYPWQHVLAIAPAAEDTSAKKQPTGSRAATPQEGTPIMADLDTAVPEYRDLAQEALDQTAEQGLNLTVAGTNTLEERVRADRSLLSDDTFVAFRDAYAALRAQVGDGERSAHAYVNADDGAALNAIQKGFSDRTAAREQAYEKARNAAIEELIVHSAPVITNPIAKSRVAPVGGMLRDALKMGAKPETLVKEAIARNDDVALSHLLGDSLWPLYAAKGVNIRELRWEAAQQRFAAGQAFPGSQLLDYLTGDGYTLGSVAKEAAVAKWNQVKRPLTIARQRARQNGR